jgi:hypothetical protein
MRAILIASAVAALGAIPLLGGEPGKSMPVLKPDKEAVETFQTYGEVVARTAAMVSQAEARRLAAAHRLQVLNVTWEDTGRYKGSSVGPNISDMTIQVQQRDPRTGKYGLTCMPVIRHPNFSDESADISPDKFFLLVGNEKGDALRKVSLREFLKEPGRYLHNAKSWKGGAKSLLAERDSHVLVSAQACFLPVPRAGIAEFNPVLFNYQSYAGDPAVLTILATREGTSVTVIDNKRDGFDAGMSWGQRLFFNHKGERASFTGQRMSDFLEGPGKGEPAGLPAVKAGGQEGLNMVLLIQVPLKQKKPMQSGGGVLAGCLPCAPMADAMKCREASNVENAVIGHGKVEGPFTEIDNLDIERDTRFPVRVTVQFYKATSNGVVSDGDMSEISAQIGKVYKDADFVGSLVVSGETGRPTEYEGDKQQPADWWQQFWKRHQQNTGQTPEQTMQMLHELYGPNWQPRSEKELAKALELAGKAKDK